MGAVLGGLAELGYDAEWESIPAASVGAPHLRYRVWIIGTQQSGSVADARSGWRPDDGLQAGRDEPRPSGSDGPNTASQRRSGRVESWPDLEHDRLQPPQLRSPVADTAISRQPRSGQPLDSGDPATSREGQAAHALDGRLGRQWAAEPDVGRVAHGVPNRVDRLRALGNAVVPQVVEVIGRQLLQAMSDAA
jgi:DNA (cytosine-5)-methyltransferase 1